MPDLTLLKQKTAELLDEGQRTGALSVVEHERRKFDLELAKTVDDIEAVVRDLMDESTESRSSTEVADLSPQSSQLTLMAERHVSALQLGARTDSLTIMGQTTIDLSGLASDNELRLEVLAIMGEVVIQVPEGLAVQVDSLPIMGECSIAPGVRVGRSSIRINVVAIMGAARVVLKKQR